MQEFREFNVRVNTEELGSMVLRCTPDNSVLYLHHPDRNEHYDHIFRRLAEDETPEPLRGTHGNLGGFIWREVLGHDEFENIATLVSNSCNFPVIYKPEPDPADAQQYEEFAMKQMHRELEDIDPEDFQ